MGLKIDVYHLNDSTLVEFLNKNNNNDLELNLVNQNEKSYKKSNCNVFIFEEESFINSSEVFNKILKSYKKTVSSIIISHNRKIHNVVKWMRIGASDYLVKSELTMEILIGSIKGAVDFNENKENSNKILKENISKDTAIKIPDQVEWSSLENDKNYNLSIVMIEIIINKISTYSKEQIENLYRQFRSELDKMAKNFGGKLWFWSNDFGALVFHFGDYINCSTLTAIQFYNNFFLLCIERLNHKEMLDFKIAINTGNCIFNNISTEHITSDVINTLTHLTKKYVNKNTFNITENTYKSLNPRIKSYFYEVEKFQNKKIFQYQFFKY